MFILLTFSCYLSGYLFNRLRLKVKCKRWKPSLFPWMTYEASLFCSVRSFSPENRSFNFSFVMPSKKKKNISWVECWYISIYLSVSACCLLSDTEIVKLKWTIFFLLAVSTVGPWPMPVLLGAIMMMINNEESGNVALLYSHARMPLFKSLSPLLKRMYLNSPCGGYKV